MGPDSTADCRFGPLADPGRLASTFAQDVPKPDGANPAARRSHGERGPWQDQFTART